MEAQFLKNTRAREKKGFKNLEISKCVSRNLCKINPFKSKISIFRRVQLLKKKNSISLRELIAKICSELPEEPVRTVIHSSTITKRRV